MKDTPIFNSIKECIYNCFGSSVSIEKQSYVGGGDINDARLLQLSNGEKVFIKTNTLDNEDFFRAEVTGINAISFLGKISTPRLLGRGKDVETGVSFLLMEYISGANRIDNFWETFGRELAEMHLADASRYVADGRFGFIEDNYIGATKQINVPKDSWISFFRDCRLEPQIKMAESYFSKEDFKKAFRLLDKLEDYLSEPDVPSLLHGDLWSGNYIVGNDGKAWLIDPAVYVGHFEADLAMTELFGRFPNAFYSSYNEVNPISPDYKERRDLYNLYHLLNHLNLFGPTYLSAVMSIVSYYS